MVIEFASFCHMDTVCIVYRNKMVIRKYILLPLYDCLLMFVNSNRKRLKPTSKQNLICSFVQTRVSVWVLCLKGGSVFGAALTSLCSLSADSKRRRALPCPVLLWMLRLILDQPPVAAPAPPCHPCPLSTPAALARPPSPPQHV